MGAAFVVWAGSSHSLQVQGLVFGYKNADIQSGTLLSVPITC